MSIQSGLDRSWIETLRAEPGKDIWLMGGGQLFRSLLEMQVVSTLELSILPLLLGDGVPLLPSPVSRTLLRLLEQRAYRSGMLAVTYAVLDPSDGTRGTGGSRDNAAFL